MKKEEEQKEILLFDQWNEIKKYINNGEINSELFPKQGEIWMCILGKNVGREQNGGGNNFSRAMLVLKKFNNEIFWVVCLSTKQKNVDYYYNFDKNSTIKGSAILAQIRLIHIKRFKRKLSDLNQKDFMNIKKKLIEYLE